MDGVLSAKRCGWLVVLGLFVLARGLRALELMPVEEIQPGMKGVGKSVFFGDKVEEFGVEVIDVMRQVSPRGDLILCRLSGAGLESTGVVAGMSGSPVYIDGKLVGAVAYAWGFAKVPIAGVTPIGEMTRIWREEAEGETRRASGVARPAFDTPHPDPLPQGARGSASGLGRPASGGIMTVPVAVSGLNPTLAEVIAGPFREIGLVPIPAGRAGSGVDGTAALTPGGAVGVGLVDGDVHFSAIGTITHREGDKLLAFGHPMFLAGDVRLPMVGGRVHGVVPSLGVSFKLFSPTQELGVVTQDRLSGISGLIGPKAPMIPVVVRLKSPTTRETYRFRVADFAPLVPLLTSAALADVVYQTEPAASELTVASRLRLFPVPGLSESSDTALVEIVHRWTGLNPGQRLFEQTRQELEVLYNNQFQAPKIDHMEVELEFTSGRQMYHLVAAQPDKNVVIPGEKARLVLRLEEWRGGQFDTAVILTIPQNTPVGPLTLLIGQRDSLMGLEAFRAPGLFEPGSFLELVKQLKRSGREDELVVAGYTQMPGITMKGKELPTLPPSLHRVLTRTKGQHLQPTTASPVFETVIPFSAVVSGVVELELEVKK
ncbi:MAG: SpoIVB peptidase S55 domain-containing protein [candidate division WOR-3 bacterium]